MKRLAVIILTITLFSSLAAEELPGNDVITGFLQEKVDQGRIAGAHAIVLKDGQPVYSKTFGYSDIEANTLLKEDAIYRIASMTKIVTSMAAMQLWEQGLFKLDDPVSMYLPAFKKARVIKPQDDPDFEPPYETEPLVREPTIRDLFRHTSGIWGGKRYTIAGLRNWQGSLDDFVERLVSVPFDKQPGTRFQYSYSIDVIGLLVEKFSGQSLDVYFKQHIFDPLELEDTGFIIPENKLNRLTSHYENESGTLVCHETQDNSPFRTLAQGLSGGGGWDYSYPGLLTTSKDWSVIMELLRNHGEFNGIRVLKPETVEMMCTDQLGSIPGAFGKGVGYGLGIGVITDGILHGEGASNGTIYWAGGPHNTYFYIDFEKKISAALMIQTGPFGIDNIMNEFLIRSQKTFGSEPVNRN